MSNENRLAAATREELRNWLLVNSTAEGCCWVEVSMKPLPDTLLYLDAVEEALCFGWIDGVKKVNAEGKLMQRLSPRSKRSSWTELNKERVRRLEKLGLMREEGRRVLPDMDIQSFSIHKIIEERLNEDAQTAQNFMAFPALYQRVRIDTIQSYIHQPELFQSRLEKFITSTRENIMYGQWHDNGRLLDY
ncbi:YdeI/OmpD-associated family protein [Paenibacillus tritici]|uniref:YdeI/OmpD-associated family protein n=1 Tax=Paenibacillus tritici TaxID=1873425 RepID=A0ABX2DVD1_9BACL|nr:YdeI/OmpD-associated family protein [Paenibacillus tritici]NQX48671.1 YdeI/OmpD-associated family protein [Paenibacillus tritici]QUL56855.1 YdeI/OmpD-associated family protein [Paenibacillus tritici]